MRLENEVNILSEKDFEKLCEYKNCQEMTFIVTVNNDYTNQILTKYLNIKENKELLNKLCSIKINLKHFLLCQKHLLETYKDLFKLINPNITDQEIINIFEMKVNEWHCSKVYSSWFNSSDNLRKSLLKLTSPNETSKVLFNDKTHYYFSYNPVNYLNSEFRWFNEENYYAAIPIYWKKNYVLEKYIGTTKEQGKLNGPDFIFHDTLLNKKIGFEVFELNPTMFIFDKPLRNAEKVLGKINKQINHKKGGNLSRNIINLLDQVKEKSKKWEKYQKTDIKVIGVIINSSVPDEWYIIMEYLINNSSELPNDIDRIFLL